MTELERVIKDVSPTSFDVKIPDPVYNIQEVHDSISKNLRFGVDQTLSYREGLETEKNKNSNIVALVQDVFLQMLDKHETITDDKTTKTVYLQNKKIARDLLINTFTIINHFNSNDVSNKTVLLGKLIQSIHDRRF
jgi:hypothetical protein